LRMRLLTEADAREALYSGSADAAAEALVSAANYPLPRPADFAMLGAMLLEAPWALADYYEDRGDAETASRLREPKEAMA
jgi:hypothetical protein